MVIMPEIMVGIMIETMIGTRAVFVEFLVVPICLVAVVWASSVYLSPIKKVNGKFI
jgi:hypothetical protein